MNPADNFNGQYKPGNIRATWHDYGEGIYFVTICAHNRLNYFGDIESMNDNGIMKLSVIGAYTGECILKISTLHRGVSVPYYQIMPNHVHLIIHIKDASSSRSIGGNDNIGELLRNVNTRREAMSRVSNQKGNLSRIISSFKAAVTKYANENKITFTWQRGFHDHIIRDERAYSQIANYIINNVSTWADDMFYNVTHR